MRGTRRAVRICEPCENFKPLVVQTANTVPIDSAQRDGAQPPIREAT